MVADRNAAIAALWRINYYRLSAYWRPFRCDDDTFAADGSFEIALEFYLFDRELRLAVMDMIERVEVAFRCAISYFLAHHYGCFAHEDPTSFDPGWEGRPRNDGGTRRPGWDEWNEDLHRETGRSKEPFIAHFAEKYAEYPRLPIWVASEVMSFGLLSSLFKGMKNADRNEIAAPFGIVNLAKLVHLASVYVVPGVATVPHPLVSFPSAIYNLWSPQVFCVDTPAGGGYAPATDEMYLKVSFQRTD